MVTFLLPHYSDIESVTNYYLLQDGTTSLFIASQEGQVEIVKLLLDRGASVDKAKMVTFILTYCLYPNLRERLCVHFISITSLYRKVVSFLHTAYIHVAQWGQHCISWHSHNQLPWRRYTCTSSVYQTLFFFSQCLATRLSAVWLYNSTWMGDKSQLVHTGSMLCA